MIKKLIIILILIALSGCSGIYNLNNFVIPNDFEFLAVIESLDTPEKICKYMEDNFEFQLSAFVYSPYQMWLANVKTRAGDCNDYSCFAVFVANWHGYETYQIWVFYENATWSHFLAVYVENKYTYSSDATYHPIQVNTFEEMVEHHCLLNKVRLRKYKVYDYEMNVIEYVSGR